MPERFSKAQVDIEGLTIHDGAPVLLRRALARLSPGDLLDVRGESPELEDELAAWCRKEGHRYLGAGAALNTYRIERGGGPAPLISPGGQIAESADPQWGLAPRGAHIEAGGPSFAFTLRQKREIWAEELTSIYKQAVANQWSAARDVPWQNLPKLPEELESAVCQIMTFLTENEFAALYVPARFIPRIHPHYREVIEVLAVQIVDEARHAEAFTRRAEAGGIGLGTSAVSGQLSLQTLLEEPDFTTAAFLLCVMGEPRAVAGELESRREPRCAARRARAPAWDRLLWGLWSKNECTRSGGAREPFALVYLPEGLSRRRRKDLPEYDLTPG